MLEPTDAELYVQETGRAGRDGQYSEAVLYFYNHDISKSSHVQASMKVYTHMRYYLGCINTLLTECA